uniref:Pyrroline-5-carboxylate reductase n=1 Tax=Blastobotrys adeninivorans TaxID=409370 RepID=A0A060T6H3_BLAAD
MVLEIKNGYTVGILGSGTMGTAVLSGMVRAKSAGDISEGAIVPDRFLAAVTRDASGERLKGEFGSKVEILVKKNQELVDQSDIIILGSKPYMAAKILEGIPAESFKNKVLVSLLAGKTIDDLTALTGGNAIVARAMTNTASKYGQGMTVVSFPEKGVADSVQNAVDWIFQNIGRCLILEEKHQDVATALCGSGIAFSFLALEAMMDGALRMGMPVNVAQECAAQVLKGAGEMVLQEGQHPAAIKSKVCTPAGTTIGGLLKLEDDGVRGSFARAVEESTNIATALGKK